MIDLYIKVAELLIIEQVIIQSGIIDYTLIISIYIYRNAFGPLIGISVNPRVLSLELRVAVLSVQSVKI